MADPTATVSDVRVEIDTGLSDTDIKAILQRVADDIDRAYPADGSIEFTDETHRSMFESTLTALRITRGRERRVTSKRIGDLQKTYSDESDDSNRLRGRVAALDPGTAFSVGTPRRNVKRRTHSITNEDTSG